jgi:Arc/MetJ family transcription regulator
VSRTTLDLDDRLLAEAAKNFGTTTKKATIHAALLGAIDRQKRRDFADWLKAGGIPGLTETAARD